MISETIDQFEFKLKENCFFLSLMPWLQTKKQDYEIELIKIPKEIATTLCTKNHNEIIIVTEGCGGITINGKSALIKFGDIISVPPHSIRSIANIENIQLEVISIKSLVSEWKLLDL